MSQEYNRGVHDALSVIEQVLSEVGGVGRLGINGRDGKTLQDRVKSLIGDEVESIKED